jgi:hypothetical protein
MSFKAIFSAILRRVAFGGTALFAGLLLANNAHAGAINYGFTFNENNDACDNATFYSNSDQCFNYRTGETGSGSLQVANSLIDATGSQTVLLSSLIAEDPNTNFSFGLTLIPNYNGLLFTASGLTSDVTFTFDNGLLTDMSFTAVCSMCGDTLTVSGTDYVHNDGNNSYYYGDWAGQKTIDQMGTLEFSDPTGNSPSGGAVTGTPEPAASLLMAGGLVTLGVFRRKLLKSL